MKKLQKLQKEQKLDSSLSTDDIKEIVAKHIRNGNNQRPTGYPTHVCLQTGYSQIDCGTVPDTCDDGDPWGSGGGIHSAVAALKA